MPTKTAIPHNYGHYFISFTCVKWLPLIAITDGYDLIYQWFDLLKSNGHRITGFIVMPNHLHITIAFCNKGIPLNTIIGNGKRFLAYAFVKRLLASCNTELLQKLKAFVKKSDKARGQKYEIWEDSFDWKLCSGDAFTWQKLDYMHNNSCRGKWMLATNILAYEHSSARFYLSGVHAAYEVFHFNHLADVDLSQPFGEVR